MQIWILSKFVRGELVKEFPKIVKWPHSFIRNRSQRKIAKNAKKIRQYNGFWVFHYEKAKFYEIGISWASHKSNGNGPISINTGGYKLPLLPKKEWDQEGLSRRMVPSFKMFRFKRAESCRALECSSSFVKFLSELELSSTLTEIWRAKLESS